MLLTLLIIVSAVCLATGLITANTVFTYVALGFAVVAAVLIIGNIALHKQKLPERSTEPAHDHDEDRSGEQPSASRHDPAASASDSGAREDSEQVIAGASEPTAETSSGPADADTSTTVHEPAANNGVAPIVSAVENDLVFVVPGRKRFHRQDCHLLRNDRQELTLEEAREEGFTGCTGCASDLTLTTNSSVVGHRS